MCDLFRVKYEAELIAVNIGRYNMSKATEKEMRLAANITVILEPSVCKITNSGWKTWF